MKDKDGKTLHPTQKPLLVLKKLIEIASNEGDVVLDSLMGVGSTAVACKETGRNYVGCELDEKYWRKGKERVSL